MSLRLWTAGICASMLWLASLAAQAQMVRYIHTDALGSPVAVTNASRTVIEISEYEPYGRVVNRPVTAGPGYTGHVMDVSTGLAYMQERYYDPGIGRFLSADPVTANSNTGSNFNRYWYANNNPYRFIDPDGRQAAPLNAPCEGCVLVTNPKNPKERFYVPEAVAVASWETMAAGESSFQDYETLDRGEVAELAGTGATVIGIAALIPGAPIELGVAATGLTVTTLLANPTPQNAVATGVDLIAKPVGYISAAAGAGLDAFGMLISNAPIKTEASEPPKPPEPPVPEKEDIRPPQSI